MAVSTGCSRWVTSAPRNPERHSTRCPKPGRRRQVASTLDSSSGVGAAMVIAASTSTGPRPTTSSARTTLRLRRFGGGGCSRRAGVLGRCHRHRWANLERSVQEGALERSAAVCAGLIDSALSLAPSVRRWVGTSIINRSAARKIRTLRDSPTDPTLKRNLRCSVLVTWPLGTGTPTATGDPEILAHGPESGTPGGRPQLTARCFLSGRVSTSAGRSYGASA